MPKYPYSLGPVKQSSKINLTQRQTAKSTVVPLGSYHRAESYIESGLREKIKSLKEGKASTIIPLLSQRLSVIEQELRSIKSQLNEANHLIKEKDSEINYLRARLAQENKNSVINNGQPKLSDEAKNEKAKAKSFDTSKERSIKNGESSSPNKEQRQQKGEIPHSVRNGESSSPNKEPRDAQIKGESPRSIKNGESSSPNKEPRDLQVKGESPRSIKNGESSSPNKEPRVLQVKGESPRSIRNGESSSPNKEQRDPEVKGESPSSRKHSRSSSPKNGQRDPQMNKERPVSRKGPCNPNVAIVRPGSHKAEYKDLRNGQLTDVDCDEPDSSTSSDSSRIQNLEKENQQLQQKISELEKFIGEYGLMWVGDKALTEENVSRPGTSENLSQGMTTIKSRAEVKLNFNLDNAITVISELNQSVPEQNIVKSPFGAKFQKCDILELKLYADGMKLEDNPFRKYDTPSAEAFFKDLEDGYFPSELKSRHPQGVIFKVVDNRQCTYEESNEDIKPTPFAGKGFRLGGEDKISVSNESDDTDFTDNSKQENRDSNNSKGKSKKKTSDKEQFVPKKVAKNIKEQNHKNSPSPKSHGSPDSIVRTGMTENMANRKLSHTTNVKNGKHNRDLGESSIASDQSELKEYWVNKHPPRPSTNVILNDNPPSIEMPSVPMEINLPPRESSSLPPTFTQAVPFKMQEEVPLKPSVSTVRPFSSNGPRVPTEPKVQIEQPNQADTDNWKNRAPINITNITYHEAPVMYQIGGDDRCMHTIRPNVNVRPEIPAACKCGHTQPKRPQRNETCPGTCGKVGVTQQPSMNVMCPCDCGGQADLHLQLPDKPKTPTTPVNEGYLQPIKFKGRTEYEDNYSRSALFRLNNLPQVQSTMDSVRPAGVPSSTPRQKIDPYEKFEHFTYLGRPKDDAAHLTQSVSVPRPAPIEMNKKTSDSMITIKLFSEQNNKTYVIHLHPNEPVSKIWSILKMDGKKYEMINENDGKPVILIDQETFDKQNIKNNDVITVRRSIPNQEKIKKSQSLMSERNKKRRSTVDSLAVNVRHVSSESELRKSYRSDDNTSPFSGFSYDSKSKNSQASQKLSEGNERPSLVPMKNPQEDTNDKNKRKSQIRRKSYDEQERPSIISKKTYPYNPEEDGITENRKKPNLNQIARNKSKQVSISEAGNKKDLDHFIPFKLPTGVTLGDSKDSSDDGEERRIATRREAEEKMADKYDQFLNPKKKFPIKVSPTDSKQSILKLENKPETSRKKSASFSVAKQDIPLEKDSKERETPDRKKSEVEKELINSQSVRRKTISDENIDEKVMSPPKAKMTTPESSPKTPSPDPLKNRKPSESPPVKKVESTIEDKTSKDSSVSDSSKQSSKSKSPKEKLSPDYNKIKMPDNKSKGKEKQTPKKGPARK